MPVGLGFCRGQPSHKGSVLCPCSFFLVVMVYCVDVVSKDFHFFYLDFNINFIHIPELIAGGQFQGRRQFGFFHLDLSHHRRDQQA